MSRSLEVMRDWLAEGVTIAAMESTSTYWKPPFYCLEEVMEVWLLNAAHIKAVPGRKTDVRDAEWIAQLLECGLLRPSFVPPADIRRLRMLTRYRVQLMGDRTREATRLELMLEDASIKLSAVASSLTTVSARAMLTALIEGERDPRALAPAIYESAGKRSPAGARHGNKWLNHMLVEAAGSVARMKGANYLSAQHARLTARRGMGRAQVAVAHSILVSAYYMLKNDEPYRELGADWLARRNTEAHTRRLVAQLERLGHTVVLDPVA
jgi:hypothetical protein